MKMGVAALLLLFLTSFLPAEERVPWKMDETYKGSYPDTYDTLRWEVPILIRQTIIDLSTILGIPFEEGWRYPLTIRFSDATVPGAENALAFVMLYATEQGIRQDLVVNVAAYEQNKFNFEKVFAHELTHAMINDAVGGAATTLFPIWLHEGLAVFAAGQGEQMVKSYVYQYTGFAESRMINGLEGPHTALDYAEDYLAIKYIDEEHGSSAVSLFVREIIDRKGDVKGAYEYTCNETWEEFLENAKEFAIKEIQDIGPAERGGYKQPY